MNSSQIYAANLAELKAKAESGDAAAQYEYAEELGWNMGILKEAEVWWKKSAQQSYPYAIIALAQYNLANISKIFPKDIEIKEKEYFSKNCPKILKAIAAMENQDTAQAYYNLGDVYDGALCVKEDSQKANNLYIKAAELGNGPAALRLAERNMQENNYSEGVRWLQRASQANMIKAKAMLARLYFTGKGVNRDEEKALGLIKEIEASNNPMGLTFIGAQYLRGKSGFPKNMEKGEELLRRAAEMDYEPALKILKKFQGD